MTERHLVTIAENVDIRRHLAINAERIGLWDKSDFLIIIFYYYFTKRTHPL